MARSLIYCSYSHLRNCERGRATRLALGAFPVSSRDPEVYAGFGDLFLSLDMIAEAQEAYERALERDYRHVYSLIGLGTVNRLNKRFAESAEYFRTVLLAHPNEPYGHGGLGASLVELGDAAGALVHLDRALAIDPDYHVAIDAQRKALAALRLAPDHVIQTPLPTDPVECQ